MQLTPVHFTKNCDNASCPTIYLDEQGNFVIQGFVLKASSKETMNLPENEDAVVVPADFLLDFVKKQQK